jgi:hypothetical protein
MQKQGGREGGGARRRATPMSAPGGPLSNGSKLFAQRPWRQASSSEPYSASSDSPAAGEAVSVPGAPLRASGLGSNGHAQGAQCTRTHARSHAPKHALIETHNRSRNCRVTSRQKSGTAELRGFALIFARTPTPAHPRGGGLIKLIWSAFAREWPQRMNKSTHLGGRKTSRRGLISE